MPGEGRYAKTFLTRQEVDAVVAKIATTGPDGIEPGLLGRQMGWSPANIDEGIRVGFQRGSLEIAKQGWRAKWTVRKHKERDDGR